MAREKLYQIPEKGVDWLKPAINPTGMLVNVIIDHYKTHGICILKRK